MTNNFGFMFEVYNITLEFITSSNIQCDSKRNRFWSKCDEEKSEIFTVH